MNKWFKNVSSVEKLRKQYRELLKKFHPDNEGGSVEATQEINAEYDRLFADLSKENKADENLPLMMMKPKMKRLRALSMTLFISMQI